MTISEENGQERIQGNISASGRLIRKRFFELQIYFFTHCIIGASRFYSTKIKKGELGVYMKMLKFIEEIIRDHFEMISLDNKFEFLVCAKICGYKSGIESGYSLGSRPFTCARRKFPYRHHNAKASPNERNDFVGAEHRNVLYIMSQTPFHPSRQAIRLPNKL